MTTYEWLSLIAILIAGFWTLHRDMQSFVRKGDCNREMGEHCERLTRVENATRDISLRVEELKSFHRKKYK